MTVVASMTAFARHSTQGAWGRATWELRSVNHRYLEITLRLPEELRGLESNFRERIEQRVKRGKVDGLLRYDGSAAASQTPHVNVELVRALIAAGSQIDALLKSPSPLKTSDLLRWPGVLSVEETNIEALGEVLSSLLEQTLEALVATRRREGGKLAQLIEQRCGALSQRIAQLRTQLPAIQEHLKNRLRQRVQELCLPGIEPGRMEQELALMLQRLDVAEEMDRLETHIAETRRVLAQDPAPGRRLDFLMQELHREANTLGSKSAHVDTTGAALDLKVIIEQMREQIQNIE